MRSNLQCFRSSKAEVAIKIYEKYKLVEAHRRKNLRREIAIMNKLDHPSLITLHHTIETKRQVPSNLPSPPRS